MPNFILKINKSTDTVYADDNIVCYLLDTKVGDDFIQNFNHQGKILLLQGEHAAELCVKHGASGIVLELRTDVPIKAQVVQIRDIMGANRILGTIIPPLRHEAMLISETEPEFVAFKFAPSDIEKAQNLISWYNDLFLIQSAVDISEGLQDVSALDTDFVIINSSDYKDFGC